MKIALLAPSGAGKTTYLTGLYGELTRLSMNPSYGIKFSIPDMVHRLNFHHRYKDLIEGKFVAASNEITIYPLNFTGGINHRYDKRMQSELLVHIVDFPGEDLHGSDEVRQEEVQKIVEGLAECDGFVVLLDGEKLVKENRARKLNSSLGAVEVNQILYQALTRRRRELDDPKVEPNAYPFSHGKTPIAFAVTKGDLLNEWLVRTNGDESPALQKKIREIFEFGDDPNNVYHDGEGEIANFIRSQFGEVIEANDIISIRTPITTYNQIQEEYEPQGLEYLFQFVLFVGLRNARIEYERRLNTWQTDQFEKENIYTNEKRYYENAKAASDKWYGKPFGSRLLDALFGDENGSTHTDRVAKYERDMAEAADKVNNSKLAVKQVEANAEVAGFFEKRVLSDKLVYLLSKGMEKGSLYQIGLPINELEKEEWWRRKLEAGKKNANF